MRAYWCRWDLDCQRALRCNTLIPGGSSAPERIQRIRCRSLSLVLLVNDQEDVDSCSFQITPRAGRGPTPPSTRYHPE
jgi:hypothetical protein